MASNGNGPNDPTVDGIVWQMPPPPNGGGNGGGQAGIDEDLTPEEQRLVDTHITYEDIIGWSSVGSSCDTPVMLLPVPVG